MDLPPRERRGRRATPPRLLVALVIAGLMAVITGVLAAPASAVGCQIPLSKDAPPSKALGPCNPQPIPPPPPPPNPWMDGQQTTNRWPTAPPRADLSCDMASTDSQLFHRPSGDRAFTYGFTLRFCYNQNRDIVLAEPEPPLRAQIQLPANRGTITASLNADIPRVSLDGPPIRTRFDPVVGEGETYVARYLLSLNYTPVNGAVQRYTGQVGIVLDEGGASMFAPAFQRVS